MQTQRQKVLIVEDEVELGMVAAKALEQHFEPVVVDDAERALQLVRTEPFDVILTDINLPNNMDGTEFIVALANEAAARKPIPIAVMTGLDAEDLRLQVLRNLTIVYCILRKPFKLELLGYLVKTMADHDVTSSRYIARMCAVH